MNKTVKILLILSVLIFVIATNCSITVKSSHLTKADLSWMDGYYNSVNKVTFVSDSGNIDYMTSTKSAIYNKPSLITVSSGAALFKEYTAKAWYDYELNHNGSIIEGYVGIKKLIDVDSLNITFSLGARYSGPKHRAGVLDWIGIHLTDYTINGKTIKNCLIADSCNSSFSEYTAKTTSNRIKKFVISKEYGLIYYKFEDGEEFTRQFDK